MIDAIIAFDVSLLRFFNSSLEAAFLDWLLPPLTDKKVLAVGGALFGVVAYLRGTDNVRRVLILSAAALILSEVLVLSLKELVGRTRPCHALEGLRVLVGCSDSYTMPSRHAADAFTLMLFYSYYWLRLAPLFIFAALFISLTRLYVGVHYPSDLLAGATQGAVIAFIFVHIEDRYREKVDGLVKRIF